MGRWENAYFPLTHFIYVGSYLRNTQERRQLPDGRSIPQCNGAESELSEFFKYLVSLSPVYPTMILHFFQRRIYVFSIAGLFQKVQHTFLCFCAHSCPLYLRHYFCITQIGIAIQVHFTEIPSNNWLCLIHSSG